MRRIARIGLVLAMGMLAGCYAARDDENADTSTSWLHRCAAPSDCVSGSDCVDGWCTMPGAQAQPSESSAPPAQASQPPMQGSQPTASDGVVVGTAPSDPNAAFLELNDVNLYSSVAVGWQGEHGVLAWVASEGEGARQLHLARVGAEGVVEKHSRPYGNGWPNDLRWSLLPDGRVAVAASGNACTLDVFEPDLQTQVASRTFPCEGDGARMAASLVPSSADFVIAYTTGAYDAADEYHGSVMAGRYHPESDTWSSMPTDLGPSTVDDALAVFTAGADAVVVWGNPNGSTLRSASGLAGAPPDPGTPAAWSEALALDARTISNGGYGMATLGDRSLLFTLYGPSLSAHVLGPDGVISVSDVASSTITDRVAGVAAAPELGLAGVCFARGPGTYIGDRPLDAEPMPEEEVDSMWFAIVRADGTPAAEPVMIADGLADMTGCDVAWSGTHFFAVTWGIFQEVVDNRYTLTSFRGVLVEPPAD